MLIGRDPDGPTGKPFTGPAGYYLNRALRSAGIDRRQCLVTNIVPTRPANGVWGNHSPASVQAGCLAVWEMLQTTGRLRQSQGLPLPLVLTLGEQARGLLAHGDPNSKPLKKQTILETRGYPFRAVPTQAQPSSGTSTLEFQCLATVHPETFLFGGWLPFNPLFEWDIKKAARWLAGERPGPRSERVARSLDDLQWVVDACLRAERVAVDIEEKAVIGLAWSEELGVAVPNFTQEPARSFVAQILESRVPKITQNGAEGLYDHTRLRSYGFNPQSFDYDLMLMWHAIEPILAGKRKDEGGGRTEKSLRFFASLLTWDEFWKNYDFENIEQEYVLCAKDARITYESCTQLLGRMN